MVRTKEETTAALVRPRPPETFVRLRLVPGGDRSPFLPDHAYGNCYVMVRNAEGADEQTLVALAATGLADDCNDTVEGLLAAHRLDAEVVSGQTVKYRDARATYGLFYLAAVNARHVHEVDAVKELLAAREGSAPRP